MKKIKTEMDNGSRPEYKRSDLGELVRAKYALRQVEFGELVRLSKAFLRLRK